jgi:hypothetical protein
VFLIFLTSTKVQILTPAARQLSIRNRHLEKQLMEGMQRSSVRNSLALMVQKYEY